MTINQLLNIDNLTELFFRDFFESDSSFLNIDNHSKIPYPVNIIKNKKNIEFQISALGLKKEDIHIETDSDILRVSHDKSNKGNISEPDYIYKGITNKAFSLGWKISPKYDLSNINAKMDDGLLIINVPIGKDQEIKKIPIN